MASTADIAGTTAWLAATLPARPRPGQISVVTRKAMLAEAAAWDALAAYASEPNPFYERWFLTPALEAFDPAEKVMILRFESEGRLAGIMPVLRSTRYYHLRIPNIAGWHHANSFLGTPLVAAGFEREFWEALFGWCDTSPGLALFLHLPHVPFDGPLYRALEAVLDRQRRHAAIVGREDRAMLASPLGPDEYFAQAMSAKKRKELRRQFNRLSDEGPVSFERHSDAVGLDRWIEDFLALEHSGWKGKAGSALACDPGTERLFRESLVGAAQAGRLERLALTLAGRPIAMLATFLAPPGAFSFKTAFDEAYARFSPGVLLQRENLAILGCEDIAWTDSCAAKDHPMIDHIWRERRAIGRISVAIGGTVRRAVFRQIARAETARMTAGRET